MINGINHVTIIVKDKIEAEQFYFDTLGLTKKMVGKSMWAQVGNQFIHISENPNHTPSTTFQHFAIAVDNLSTFLQELIAKGVSVFDLNDDLEEIDVNTNLDKPNRQLFLHDPSGNIVELVDSNNYFFKQS